MNLLVSISIHIVVAQLHYTSLKGSLNHIWDLRAITKLAKTIGVECYV